MEFPQIQKELWKTQLDLIRDYRKWQKQSRIERRKLYKKTK